jgi:hypothetical protein
MIEEDFELKSQPVQDNSFSFGGDIEISMQIKCNCLKKE